MANYMVFTGIHLLVYLLINDSTFIECFAGNKFNNDVKFTPVFYKHENTVT